MDVFNPVNMVKTDDAPWTHYQSADQIKNNIDKTYQFFQNKFDNFMNTVQQYREKRYNTKSNNSNNEKSNEYKLFGSNTLSQSTSVQKTNTPAINTSQKGNNNTLRTAMNYFVNKGLSRQAAAGIVGNLAQESNGNIHASAKEANGSYSFGLAQWNGKRKSNLFSISKTQKPTLQHQLDFLWHELNGSENKTLQKLVNAKTPEEASKIFCDSFERPDPKYANYQNRAKQARMYYNG